MRTGKFYTSLFGIGALIALGTSAFGQVSAVNVTGTASNLSNPPFTLGWEFTANSPISVTNLGVYDSTGAGLTDSYQVGLWNSTGTLLTSTTVDSGTTDPLVQGFRQASTSAVTLTAGQSYFIGALYLDGNDGAIFPGGAGTFSTAPQITFVQTGYSAGSTLADPTNTVGTNPAYFGPSFEFRSAVPEPSSLAAFAVAGLGLVGALRRARGRRTPSA